MAQKARKSDGFELYPWPVFAQVDCDDSRIDDPQIIVYDSVEYSVILKSVRWQSSRGTFRYRMHVECEGLGWHSRSFSDDFDMCGTPDGRFVTLFHARTEEPLERMARAFFARRWKEIRDNDFRSLAVSRFLTASIASQVAMDAFDNIRLEHYPTARLLGGNAPLFASGRELWIGYRFFSEDAYEWTRRTAGEASRVVALYFADTKYQFRTDLPLGTEIRSLAELDASVLAGRYEEFITVLLRGLELPTERVDPNDFERVRRRQIDARTLHISDADVNEALSALKLRCTSVADLRYQLAAAVVVNAWIDQERRLGYTKRKKFYAFKQTVQHLAEWALEAQPSGVDVCAESTENSATPVLRIRIDGVDFSFHAIPMTRSPVSNCVKQFEWTGLRLKPLAPLVLAWARALRANSRIE